MLKSTARTSVCNQRAKVGTRWNPWKIGTTPQAGKEGVTFGDIWAYLEDGQLTCVGQGTISAQAFAAIGSARSSVKSLVISNGIVAIENNAFAGIGTVAEPVELHLPSNWSVDDVPLFNTSWRGGFFFSKPFNLTVPCAAPIEITGVTIDGVTQDTLPAPGIPAVYTVYVGSSVTVQYSFSGQKYQRTLRIGPSGPDGAYVPVVEVDAKYVDADGNERQTTATLITESTRVLDDGRWYVTTGTIVNGAGLAVANGATANLILADGAALTAQGEWNRPGLRVERGAALNVYGQSGGRGALKATGGNGDVGVGIGGAVTVYGGIFWKDPKNWGTVARDFHVVENPDAETKGTYPWLVESSPTVHVEVGILEHMTAVWTSDDGETNAVENGSFEVLRGTTGVKVIFTPEVHYGLDNAEFVLDSPLNADYTLTEDNLPTAEYRYVVVTVGKLEHMTAAWTSDNGETNKVVGDFFEVPKGTTGVKVIFTPEDYYMLNKTEYVFDGLVTSDCTIPADDLPTAEYIYAVVTVGELERMTAVWTSDNGETNAIKNGSFEVLKGTTGVKVIFTPNVCYELQGNTEFALASPLNADYTMTEDDLPKAVYISFEVSYLVWDEAQKELKNATLVVNKEEMLVTPKTQKLEDRYWYVVSNEVECGTITVSGTANLVLTDGAKLTVNGGICVEGDNALNIYGQIKGTGELVANGNILCAGIGGNGGSCGTVTINGGTVTATGGESGMGIGVGSKGAGGTVTINGGTVTAQGSTYCAGIGGGTVTINGGVVTAKGGSLAAGIGGNSVGSSVVHIMINGGLVMAEGGERGAGIGNGFNGTGADVTINETKVVVGAGSVGGPSVRLWERTLSRTVRFPVVNGLTVRATVGGIEHNVATEGGVNTVIVAVGDQLTLDFSPVGTTVTMQGENPVVVDVAKNMTLSLDDLPTAGGVGGVPYRDWTGSGFKDAVADAVALNSDASELLDGRWYVVTDEVECGAITVSGTANLILADGAKLTVKGGICVEGKNALNIYGQAEGTGELVANNSKSSAGIGGGWGGKGGIITINGGTVTAQGGVSGAGIGGGGNGGNGGTVTINGGTVTAQGGSSGAGIGGGMKGAGGTVTINGGTVTATGGTSSAGIGGGGNGVNGGDVTINGGMVTAQGGSSGAGIGGGLKGDGGTVMIYGGDVTAIGGMSGAGIGGGNGGNGGNVTINGGTVTATGGEWGAGIGGGAALSASVGYVGGAGGTVTINGGTVTAQGGKDAAGIGGGSESDSDGSVYRDEKKVSMVDGNVGKGYRYVKFVEIGLGPTCTGGDIAKEGGVWVVKPTGNATEVAITGLPTGDSLVVPPSVTKVTGASDDKIIVKSGTVDITDAFTITGGAIALNPEGEVNGVPVKPIIGKLDGEDAPATQPFTLGEGDAAVTVATIPGLVYELKLTTDLGTAFGTIRDGVKATGDGKPVKLTDTDPPKVKAFYIIDVSAP